jgi:hypothetical protein
MLPPPAKNNEGESSRRHTRGRLGRSNKWVCRNLRMLPFRGSLPPQPQGQFQQREVQEQRAIQQRDAMAAASVFEIDASLDDDSPASSTIMIWDRVR